MKTVAPSPFPSDVPLRAGDVVLVPMTVSYPSDGSGRILGRVGHTSVGIDADEIHSQVFRSFGLGEQVAIDGRLATVRALVDSFVIVTGWNGRPEPMPVPSMDVRPAPMPEADDPDFREVGEAAHDDVVQQPPVILPLVPRIDTGTRDDEAEAEVQF